MLKFIRNNAKSWVVKMLLGFLALTFAIWGVGDYVNSQNQNPVATVNGREISQRDFTLAYDNDIERMRRLFGNKLDKATAERMGMKDQSLALMINRSLVHDEIRAMRLTVSPTALQQTIAATTAFQVGGRFDAERYAAVLRSTHLSPVEYESQLSGDLMASQFERTLRVVSVVPEAFIEDLYRMEQERRGGEIYTLSSTELAAQLRPGEAELEGYLKENPDRFLTQHKLKLRYAVLDSDSLRDQLKVSEEEIKAHYDELAAEQQKKDTRHLRHILATSDGSPEGEKAAQAKIAQAQAALQQGVSFENAARQFSDDVTTAPQGGDLGPMDRESVPSPEVAEVAFALPQSAVSAPVKSEFGWHLVWVDSILASGVKPLAALHDEIREQLFQSKAQEAVYDRSVKMEDQIFSAGDLRTVAKEMNLRYRETEFIQFDSPDLVGIESHAKFQETAMTTPKGEKSPLVELDDARFFVLEVVDRQDPRPMTLAEARKEVEAAYREDGGRRLAKERMEALLKKMQGGGNGPALAKVDPAVQVRNIEPLLLGDKASTLSAAAQRTLFRLTPEAPLHPQVIDEGREFIIVRLGKVVEAEMKGLEAARAELRGRLEQDLGEEQFTTVLSWLSGNARIEVNQEILKRF